MRSTSRLEAPSARRSDSSPDRAIACAEVRLAMFTQAISSTNAVAANSISSGARIDPYCHSRAGSAPSVQPMWVRGNSCASWREIVASSSRAWAIVAPGASSASAIDGARRRARLRLGARDERREDVRVEERHRKRRREDADDRVRLVVDDERRAENAARAERVAPVAIGDDARRSVPAALRSAGTSGPCAIGAAIIVSKPGRHGRAPCATPGSPAQRHHPLGQEEALEAGQRAGALAKARHFHLLQRVALQDRGRARRLPEQMHDRRRGWRTASAAASSR